MLIKHFPFRRDARLLKGKAGPPRECQGKAVLWTRAEVRPGPPGPWAGGSSCPLPCAPGLAPAPTWALLVCSSGLGPCVIQEEGAVTSPGG